MRVVSLVPSVTETLLAWGIEPVACTRFCEQPRLRHVGGTKDPDVDAIVALHPDLVVVDEEENRREDAEALRVAGVPVHALAVRSVADAASQLTTLAAVVGVEVAPWAPPPLQPPWLTAFVPIWRRPWMGLGVDTYGSDLLARLGVANALADRDGRYPEADLDEVVADVVLAPSEPYPFGERHVAELERVAPVVLVDGQDLFWWGTRTPAALARLRAQLDARSG
jgi:ABC-type Fe3+-hydroxamate transport system substrate-binding protein